MQIRQITHIIRIILAHAHIQSRLIVTLMQLSGRDLWSVDMRCRMNAAVIW